MGRRLVRVAAVEAAEEVPFTVVRRAAFVCPAGATYGAPTWGAVAQIGPPTSGAVTRFQFLEGPTWIASIGTLFFSDVGAKPEHTFKLGPPATAVALFLQGSGTNGLSLDNEDKLIVADQKDRSVLRVDPMTGATLATLVAPGAGSFTMDSPNDIVVRSDGNIYLTDPSSGLYRAAPSGTSTGPYKLTGPFKQVNSPNGVVLSTDENTLYVGDMGTRQIKGFPVMADGTVDTASGKLIVTAKGGPDGLCLDCAGNLYASTSRGHRGLLTRGGGAGHGADRRGFQLHLRGRRSKDPVRGSAVGAQGGADDHSWPARLILIAPVRGAQMHRGSTEVVNDQDDEDRARLHAAIERGEGEIRSG